MFRVTLAVALLLTVGACSDDEPAAVATTAPATVAGAGYTVLSPQEGNDLLASGTALTLIDVRTPAEFAAGHIEGAVNSDIEGGAFSGYLAGLDKNATYVVYCHSGRRAKLAAEAMVSAGFTHVYDLGGITEWEAAGFPVVQ